LIYSVTGGGIHPVAQKIADLTGGKPFDGFNSKAGFEEIACVVIDCGGTARVGVYPMKGIPTIDVYPASPSGPLAKHINEQNFVSGVKPETVKPQE
jgi:sorbitol-specific phosphotransferase system component IIBC